MPKHTGEQATLFNNGPKELVRQVARFAVYLWDRFVEDNCQSTAASLTYQTLFAVVPLLTVTYAILDTFKAFGDLTEKVETFLFSNIIPENVMMVQEYLLSFSQQARNLSGPSIALLGVTAFLMLFTIEKTFNEIWRVKEPRQGFQRFLMYWAVLTLSAPFMGISLGITGYIESLPLISD
ncbi:MAG: YihY family inner membrane protein, partial [Pseudomonadales bacterium]